MYIKMKFKKCSWQGYTSMSEKCLPLGTEEEIQHLRSLASSVILEFLIQKERHLNKWDKILISLFKSW